MAKSVYGQTTSPFIHKLSLLHVTVSEFSLFFVCVCLSSRHVGQTADKVSVHLISLWSPQTLDCMYILPVLTRPYSSVWETDYTATSTDQVRRGGEGGVTGGGRGTRDRGTCI